MNGAIVKMDYSRFYVGDTVIYQGNICANNSVIRGGEYVVVETIPNKPRHAFIQDEHGNKKLIQMSFNYAKIKGR